LSFSLTNYITDTPDISIVDVGSSLIKSSLDKSFDYQPLLDVNRARVIGFEADETRAKKANEATGDHMTVLNRVIYDGTVATFHENAFSLTSSLLPSNHDLIDRFHKLGDLQRTLSTSEVQTFRLDDCVDPETVDALFLDTQGAELKILENATRVLENALVIQTEIQFVPLYTGAPLFGDIDVYLRSRGFMFHTLISHACRTFKPIIAGGDEEAGLRQYVWGDAVYMPDITKLGDLSREQLLKLALIMQDVYGSVDVAFEALNAIDLREQSSLAPGLIDAIVASGG